MLRATNMMHSSLDREDPGHPGQNAPTDFDTRHANKPTKAIIGVAILMVLSFVLYEVNGKGRDVHSLASHPAPQTVASTAH